MTTCQLHEAEDGIILEDCPGCGQNHIFLSHVWKFNGNMGKPTFEPSLKMDGWINIDGEDKHMLCHFHLTDGAFRFCNDSNHHLRGKRVEVNWQ